MRRLLVGMAGVALVGASVLATAPRGEIERMVDLVVVSGDAALATQVVVDTDRGEIRSDAGRLTSFVPAPEVRMALRGESGDGVVAITVVDPEGDLYVHELVGPEESFDLSTPVAPDIEVNLTASPATVPAPGAEVVVRLELTLQTRVHGPVHLTAAYAPSNWTAGPHGPEHESPGTIERIATLGIHGPDGCAAVLGELPVRLEPDVPLACTFVVDVAGQPGDEVVGELGLVVEVGDMEAEIAGAAVTIPVTEAVGDAAPDVLVAPEGGAGDEVTERLDAPLHGVLVGDAGGRYVIDVAADRGSPGFTLRLGWFEPAPPVGALLAAVWVVAGLAGLAVAIVPYHPTHRGRTRQLAGPVQVDRLAAAGLGLAGLTLVVGLWLTADRSGLLIVGGAHAWYWTPAYPALGTVTHLLITVGILVASPGARHVSVRRLGLVVLGVGVAVAAIAILAGVVGFAHGSEGATYYAGDYLLLAAHVQATVLAGVLLATGALLRGTPPRRAVLTDVDVKDPEKVA